MQPEDRSRGTIVPLVDAIYSSMDTQDLAERYLEAIPHWIVASAYGFYLFDEHTGRPEKIRATGVSKLFLDRYENLRPVDPLLDSVRRRKSPNSTDEMLSGQQWRRHALAELFAEERLCRYMLAPLVVNGRLVGTLNFARCPQQPAFDQQDLAAVDVAARHVSRALAYSNLLRQEHLASKRLRAALNALPLPVVITPSGDSPYLNRAAQRLVAQADCSGTGDLLRLLHTGRFQVRSIRVSGEEGTQIHLLHSGVMPTPPSWSEAAGLLSPRERELVCHVARGLRNEELAKLMGVSINTVKQHLKRLFRKLGVRNRAEAVTRVLGKVATPDSLQVMPD